MQVELVCKKLYVSQDFGLRRVALRPIPLLLDFIRKRIRVLNAFKVTPRSRVPVPVPGPPYSTALLKNLRSKAELSHAMERVESREACSDDQDIVRSPVGGTIRADVFERH